MISCRNYNRQTITDSDNADHLTLYTITPAQAESLLHDLEQSVGTSRIRKQIYVLWQQYFIY